MGNNHFQKEAPIALPRDFEEWIMHHFGPTILDVFFKPYTKKVWTVDTAKMCVSIESLKSGPWNSWNE